MYNETTRLVKVVMPENAGDGIVSGDSPLLASANPTRTTDIPEEPTDSQPIMLSDTAENLFIAYEVVAMVKDEETGKTHFSQLKWKRLGTVEEEDGGDAKSVADPSGDGEQIGVKGAMRDGSDTSDDDTSDDEPQLVYQFMFESGDLFVAYAADEYPALDGDELQMLNDSSSGGGSGGSGGGSSNVVHGTLTSEDGDFVSCVLDKTAAEIAALGSFFVIAEGGGVDEETGDEYTLRFYGTPMTLDISDGAGTLVVLMNISGASGMKEFLFDSLDDYPTWTSSSSGPIH